MSPSPPPTPSGSAPTLVPCKLYLITPPTLPDLDGFCETLSTVLATAPQSPIDQASVIGCLQIRLKGRDGSASETDAVIRTAVQAIQPICHEHGIAVLLNDRPDLASDLGCDGVHVGQADTPYAEARRLVGGAGIVGVTCHDSRHLAMEAGEAGADYVAFGAFFATHTKDAATVAAPELIEWWTDTTVVPSVAIGGITPENCAPIVEAGADFLAVSAGVWQYSAGPQAAVAAFAEVFAAHPREVETL